MNNLDKLRNKCSPQGLEWFVAATDPFHDYQYKLEGLPDEMSQNSIVMVHNQVTTITPDPTANPNWDAAVLFTGCHCDDGELGAIHGVTNVEICPFDSQAYSADRSFGSFIISTNNSGASVGVAAAVQAFPSAFANIPSRLIGVAFEVHDTTAEISKQGSVTVAQLSPWSALRSTTFYPDVQSVVNAMYAPRFTHGDAPAYASTLAKIPGSCTWEARDGCYVIPRMCTNNVSIVESDNESAMVWTDEIANYATGAVADVTTGLYKVPKINSPSVSAFLPTVAMFSGLSIAASLRVTMRTIVEYFPPPSSDLIAVSSPSAPYDPAVFQLYSRTVMKAPYAVKVGENAGGDYFRKILRVVGTVASTVAPALGPFSGIVGTGGNLANEIANMIEAKQKAAKSKGKPKPRKPVSRTSAGAGAMVNKR